ncbi:hypothetical protein SAMN05446037_1006115 [Anaerovirgula multivorans]|uniref:Uncharacterized protein n=2 Tax=Anaerovirgula multivorans TaxID=312168 RepID=A0A239CS28_9FIRM|nr:hypothetical protein SAMN05446037_1006115 [Anaerovirgula multivorans]
MIKNSRVEVNEEGNIVITVLTGVDTNKELHENIEDLKKVGRMYIPETGQKGKPCLFFAEFEGKSPYQKYDEVIVNGIKMKLTLSVKVEEEELNRAAELKQAREIEKKRLEGETAIKENQDLKQQLANMQAMLNELMADKKKGKKA